MANRKQPERWESGVLAAAMAVVGTLFLFDKLGSLMRTGLISFAAVLHSAPILLVAMGVSLLLAEPGVPSASPHAGDWREGHYE